MPEKSQPRTTRETEHESQTFKTDSFSHNALPEEWYISNAETHLRIIQEVILVHY